MKPRQTSIEAYKQIRESGLLSRRKFEVYEYVFHHGPVTARQAVKELCKIRGEGVAIAFGSYATRFSELRNHGVLQEVGETVDLETKQTVILWDVTRELPRKPKKPTKVKCHHCDGRGYFEQGNLF